MTDSIMWFIKLFYPIIQTVRPHKYIMGTISIMTFIGLRKTHEATFYFFDKKIINEEKKKQKQEAIKIREQIIELNY